MRTQYSENRLVPRHVCARLRFSSLCLISFFLSPPLSPLKLRFLTPLLELTRAEHGGICLSYTHTHTIRRSASLLLAHWYIELCTSRIRHAASVVYDARERWMLKFSAIAM
ncbi:hypothetical protein B0F90DRAFT_960217 [Multifurca ochricompacta]|uniref:Uncharacterized protein n=1 Tax=Multifurca ochricompacta TaxID=376703 RepID=A0AAD4M930_9AGAM|nr:hypothetical protein B0F90DRAFT_960217 [Multifurca ochricompacta]